MKGGVSQQCGVGSVTIYGSCCNIKLGAEPKNKSGGKKKNWCQTRPHPPKDSGLCSVGNREPSWIFEWNDVMRFTAPEVGM